MKREYSSSVSLIILGKGLMPDLISKLLGIQPSQQWARGDLKIFGKKRLSTKHSYGGWKKFLPNSFSKRSLESQVGYWIKALARNRKQLKAIRSSGNVAYLDLFVATDETATLVWSDEIVKGLANLGIELKFNIWANNSNTRTRENSLLTGTKK